MKFEDGNHALLTGEIIGLLLATLTTRGIAPTQVEPVMDDDGFTNQIRIIRPSGNWLLTVTKDG